MNAKILILREFGRLKVPVGIANKASGSISLYHEHPSSSDERTVPVLHMSNGRQHPFERRKQGCNRPIAVVRKITRQCLLPAGAVVRHWANWTSFGCKFACRL